MQEITFEENKKYQLEILKDVTNFCDENGITYFLAFGTLIGAVRHKGFIPWDDDIDIQMPRPDYIKFLKAYKGEHFKVISPYDTQAKHSVAKVIDTRTVKIEKAVKYEKGQELGIDIDIFPIDAQPDDEGEFLKYFKNKQIIYRLFYFSICDFWQFSLKAKIAYLIPSVIGKLVGKNYFMKKIDQINAHYDYETSNYVGSTSSLYEGVKNRALKEWYKDSILMDFEGSKYKVPVGYHEILTKIYGDYMQLPPEEKRITHHKNKTFLKD